MVASAPTVLFADDDVLMRRQLPDGVPTGRPPVRFGTPGERGLSFPHNGDFSPVEEPPPVAISPAPGGGPAGPDPVGNHPYMITSFTTSQILGLYDLSQVAGQFGNYEPHSWLGVIRTPSIIKTSHTYGALSGYNNTTNGVNGWKFVLYPSGGKLRLRFVAVSTTYNSAVDLELDRLYAVAFTADDGGVGNTTIKLFSLDLETPGATVNIETMTTVGSITNSGARYNLFGAEGYYSAHVSMCGAAWWNRGLSDAEIREMMDEGGSGHFSRGGPEPLDYDNMSAALKTGLVCYHTLGDELKSGGAVDAHTGGIDLTFKGGVTQADPFTFRTPGPGQPDSALFGDPTTEYTFQHEWRLEVLANGPWFRDHGQAASKTVMVSVSEEDGDPCVIDAGGVPVVRNVSDPAEIAGLAPLHLFRDTMVPTMDTAADYVLAWVTDSYPLSSPDTYVFSIRGQTSASYRLQVQWPGGLNAWNVEWYRANVFEAGSAGMFQTAFRVQGWEERQWHTWQLRISGNVMEWWGDGICLFKIKHNEVTDTFRDQIESFVFGARDNNSDGFLLDGGNGAFAWAGIAKASDITAGELHQYMIDRLDERTGLTATPEQRIRPENNPPLTDITYTPQTFVNSTVWQYLWYCRWFFGYHEEEISTRAAGGTTYLRKWGSGLSEDIVAATSRDLRNTADDTTQPRVKSDNYEFTDSTVTLAQASGAVDSWRETDAMLFMVAYFDSGGGLKPNFSIISQAGNSSFFVTLDVINSDGTVRMIDGATHTSSAGAMVYDQWLIIAWLHEEAGATDRIWFNGGSPIINTAGGSGTRDGALFRFLGIGAGTTPWKFRDLATLTVDRHIPSSEYLTVINEIGAELDARTPGASVWSTAT